MTSHMRHALAAAMLGAATLAVLAASQGHAQAPLPTLVDTNLAVREASPELSLPIGIAFIGASDMLVLEKDTGKVQRVTGGALGGTVLDLAVNSASERGLLGIALHPQFAVNGFVYLYWSESTTGDRLRRPRRRCRCSATASTGSAGTARR